MRKTKKQKLLADLRRKISMLEKTTEIQKPIKIELPVETKKEPPKTFSFSQVDQSSSKSSALTTDSAQISKDLKKTLFFSAVIVSALTIIKLVLK